MHIILKYNIECPVLITFNLFFDINHEYLIISLKSLSWGGGEYHEIDWQYRHPSWKLSRVLEYIIQQG